MLIKNSGEGTLLVHNIMSGLEKQKKYVHYIGVGPFFKKKTSCNLIMQDVYQLLRAFGPVLEGKQNIT